METNLHRLLMNLLIDILESLWQGRDFFAGGNMFFYFSALQAKKNDYRGPDFFVVLDTEHRQRESWVVWEEGGKMPDFILEITSESTAAMDRGEKKRVYGKVLHVPEYFIYDPATRTLEGYRLGPGSEYVPISADADGRLESRQLGLLLGPHLGTHNGYRETWLRWYLPDGQLVPTREERAASLEERAASLEERLRAYEERFGPLPGPGK